MVFLTIKKWENLGFCTKLVPTTSELKLTGSTYYSSAVTM